MLDTPECITIPTQTLNIHLLLLPSNTVICRSKVFMPPSVLRSWSRRNLPIGRISLRRKLSSATSSCTLTHIKSKNTFQNSSGFGGFFFTLVQIFCIYAMHNNFHKGCKLYSAFLLTDIDNLLNFDFKVVFQSNKHRDLKLTLCPVYTNLF